jgi:hypothetical protein
MMIWSTKDLPTITQKVLHTGKVARVHQQAEVSLEAINKAIVVGLGFPPEGWL